MRTTILLVMTVLLLSSPTSAAISTGNNFIDQAFNGAAVLYPVDLDKDGDMDVVGVTGVGTEIAWWENNGSETFTKWSIDGVGFNGATGVVVIDLNNDGDVDILFVDGNNVFWYENPGPPYTQTPWPVANRRNISAAFVGANSIFAIDINKDGDIDVLATDGNTVTWWENPGAPYTQNPWPAANQRNIDAAFAGANSVFAIDMNKDGDIDVLSTDGTNVTWWENPGAPYTQNPWPNQNQWNIDIAFNGANFVFAIDMDKDGDIDVLSTAGTGAGVLNDVSWWENSGSPNANTWTEYIIDDNFNGAESIFAIDLDFDGDIDVAGCGGAGNTVSWWENDGSPRQSSWTENIVNLNFTGASFVYACDIDSDGDIDLLGTADIDNDIAWWANDANLASGNVGFLAEQKIDDFLNGASSVSSSDIDTDGDNDVVGTARLADDLIWWESDGSPANGGWTEHVLDTNFDGAKDNTTADLDRDGDIDIVAVSSNDDELAWWENNGSESFTKRSIDTGFDGANSVFIIDLDTDGDLDIAATAGQGDDVAWWANDGSPANGGWVKSTVDGNFNGATDVHCVDLDRDGDIDILATADIDDDVAWWDNNGSESFTKRLIDSDFNGANSVKTGDLDQDGDIDVIACASSGSVISWWSNDGSPANGGWTEYTIEGTLSGASEIYVIDIDLDGDLDVGAAAKSADKIGWWENDGSPADGWTEHVINSSFNGAVSVFLLDLDRDAYIDILGAAEDDDDICWWENGGASVVTTPSSTEAATASLQVDFTVISSEDGDSATSSGTPSAPGSGESSIETDADLQEIDVKCFIATAAFGTANKSEIERLRQFRDKYLMENPLGRSFVYTYYKISPPLARAISRNAVLKDIVKIFIKILLEVLPV
ncbi:MAG: VCBS repeat-containing protein [Candidatus Omnitrophica bacterium]|nr:VCBS repeat-containing protein [Candidatus Omnitrophota bacterium]